MAVLYRDEISTRETIFYPRPPVNGAKMDGGRSKQIKIETEHGRQLAESAIGVARTAAENATAATQPPRRLKEAPMLPV